MELCSSEYATLTKQSREIILYTSIIGLALTLFGSGALIKKSLLVKQHIPLTKLVIYTANWDMIYSISIFIYEVFSGSYQDKVLCIIYMIHYIAILFSTCCTTLIVISGIILSRVRQLYFQAHYKLWLLLMYILVTFYFITLYIVDYNSTQADNMLLLIYTPGFILFTAMLFGTLRLLYMLKTYNLELKDKTPIWLSANMVVFYGTIFFADIQYLNNNIFFWFCLSNFLKSSAGFANFLVGYKRVSRAVNEILSNHLIPIHEKYEGELAASREVMYDLNI